MFRPYSFFVFAVMFGAASAVAEPADHYQLGLGWTPGICAEGAKADDPRCAVGAVGGFVVDGLWPRDAQGQAQAPCAAEGALQRHLIDRLMALMPGAQRVQQAWREQGACVGTTPAGYVEAVEKAHAAVKVPETYAAPTQELRVPLAKLRSAWLRANPRLSAEGIAFRCEGRALTEVRICLDRGFAPRACSSELRDACPASVIVRTAAPAAPAEPAAPAAPAPTLPAPGGSGGSGAPVGG